MLDQPPVQHDETPRKVVWTPTDPVVDRLKRIVSASFDLFSQEGGGLIRIGPVDDSVLVRGLGSCPEFSQAMDFCLNPELFVQFTHGGCVVVFPRVEVPGGGCCVFERIFVLARRPLR